MYIRIFLLLMLLGNFYAQAQESVGAWQEKHPQILLMNHADYSMLENDMKKAIEGRVILYYNEPSMSDINSFMANTHQETPMVYENHHLSGDKDGNYIKQWLGMHPGLKIVPQSVYQMSNDDDKIEYKKEGALILSNEQITIEDIENYEAIN